MTLEFTVITGIIGIITAILTFFIGRTTAAKKEGEEAGAMRRDITHIKDNMSEMRADIKNSLSELKTSLNDDLKKHDDSIRRLHERIDDQSARWNERFVELERKFHTACQ